MSDSALSAPDAHRALLAVLTLVGALGLWAERTRLGARLSGVVVTIGGTLLGYAFATFLGVALATPCADPAAPRGRIGVRAFLPARLA